MTRADPAVPADPADLARPSSGRLSPRRPLLRRLLTSAGRHELAGHALQHPVRTILVVYVLSRLVALVAMWVAAVRFQNPAGVGHPDPGLRDLVGLWDTVWYERIVRDGYPSFLPADPDTGALTYSEWAFYPLYPYLVRGMMATGLPFVAAGIALNVVLGAVAALLTWAVFRPAHGVHRRPDHARLALIAACLWCFYPATAVMLMPYTEALAAVLVTGAILMLMRRRYLVVSVVSLALGLSRGVAPALGIAVLIHLGLRWRGDRAAGRRVLDGQRLSAAVMIASVGVSAVLWPAIVGAATGRPQAFFEVQAAWGQRPADGPFVMWLRWAWDAKGLGGVLVLVALVASYLALVLGRHARWISIEARAWALAYPLFLVALVRPITSMWRFLLLDFPLAALLASVGMRTATGRRIAPHWRRRVVVIVALLVLTLFVYCAVLLTQVPWGDQPP